MEIMNYSITTSTRKVLAVILLLLTTPSMAAPPLESDVKRFVAAYRADESIAFLVKDVIYEDSMQDGPHKQYYACVNSNLTPTTFNQLAAEVVQANFSDARRLQEATVFFETSVGKKLRDSAIEVLRLTGC
jgi:hypothetical protein